MLDLPEGNAYTIDFHPFIYSKLSADLLEKTKDIREEI